MLPPPFLLSTDQRQKRSLTPDVIPFLNNIIFQNTNPLSFETEPHSIYTIPLVREHCDSYLNYVRYKTIEVMHSQNLFQNIFNPVHGINTGTYYRTVHPRNITLSIQDVFISYIDKLIDHNENLDTPVCLPPHLESLREKHEYFELPDLETKISRHNIPHYWLKQDTLQIKQFQYRFFQNIILNSTTNKSLLTFLNKLFQL